MASLTALPLDIFIEISKFLPLRDALHFSKTCNTAFDAVHYVFRHRKTLNFSPFLDSYGVVALGDQELLSILCAHTRIEQILHFCPHPTFTSFQALAQHLCVFPLHVQVAAIMSMSLYQAYHLSQMCPQAFDAVYYTFAHQTDLDFSSFLDGKGVIALPDNEIMTILHAHTRARSIHYFCLPPTFTSFDALKQYFSLYLPFWLNGHDTGFLSMIHCPRAWQCDLATHPIYIHLRNMLCIHEDDHHSIINDEVYYTTNEWSCEDLDAPFLEEQRAQAHIDYVLNFWHPLLPPPPPPLP